jgi:signal transduction histidine kinase
VQAQENERQRIARDVHDGLNQLLIGALLELTSGQRRIELGQLEAARESLESSQAILRSVETGDSVSSSRDTAASPAEPS